MSVTWQEVFSSNVSRIGYDDETQTLLVQWAKGGKTSAYEQVPPDVADEAARNWSVGQYINDSIKPRYRHKYV